MFKTPDFAKPRPASCGQSLPREVEGAVELGCIRPDLLTAEQVHMLAWFAKRRLEADSKALKPVFIEAA